MNDFRHPDPLVFVPSLRQAVVALSRALCNGAVPQTEDLEFAPVYRGIAGKGVFLMDELIAIAGCLDPGSGSWPSEPIRMTMSRGHTFVDDWPLDPDEPLTVLIEGVDTAFLHLHARPPLPADGQVLDEPARSAVARYIAWRQGYDAEQVQERAARVAKREASAPPHRNLPHRPDPRSLLAARTYAHDHISIGTDPAGIERPTPSQQHDLAGSYLTRGMVDHWLQRDPAGIRSDLSHAAGRMALALPTVQIHAWEYEQWQHLAVAVGHRGLLDALWALRREEWDTNRIRPVNWLICRIRILDLLHQGGSEAELRGLLEMSWIGLFADPLPPELAVDTPLMRNWHELLHAILDRDTAAFDRHLATRQDLLAAHWTRGGGIAPLSLADLGGLALVRTARARGLTPATPGLPYLAFDLLLS
jgi:hypothetical protein